MKMKRLFVRIQPFFVVGFAAALVLISLLMGSEILCMYMEPLVSMIFVLAIVLPIPVMVLPIENFWKC